MSESGPATGAGASWVPLTPRERRVLGVLVEKAKTTPEYYPLSVAAIVTGCNQKSNRDPVTNYDPGRRRGDLAQSAEEGSGHPRRGERPGRAVEAHALRLDESEQGRAGRHGRAVVAGTADRRRAAGPGEPDGAACGPAGLAGDSRGSGAAGPGAVSVAARAEAGCYVAHGLYPAEELERVRQAFASRHASDDEAPTRLSTARVDLAAAPVTPAWSTEIAALRGEVDQLRRALDALTNEVRELKSALGA